MKIDIFELERIQSLFENRVKYNLTESGIHPYTLQELLEEEEIEALVKLRLGYGQTNGADELRSRIAELYDGAGPENILVTNGSAEANFLAVWSLLEPGDEMVMMLPNYMQMWGVATAFGIQCHPFHLKESLRWAPDLAELKEAVTPRTKLIVLCNPNNPTGAILYKEEMAEIINLAESVGAWIYADEIYRGAELNGDETTSFFGMYDKVLVNGGLSKAYALPGLRLGWLAGPAESVAGCWAYHDYTSISTGLLSQCIAQWILQPLRRNNILGRNRKILRENLRLLTTWIENHGNLFDFIPPQAGGIAFIRYNLDINSRQLATRLREEKSVFVMAGNAFGLDYFFRIGIGSPHVYLQSGLDQIDSFLKESNLSTL